MGLFSFVKNVGTNMFGPKKTKAKTTTTKKKATPKPKPKPRTTITNIDTDRTIAPKKIEKVVKLTEDQEMAIALKAVVDNLGLEVDDLKITVKGDAVTVEGMAATHAEKEKIILALGNVTGIASVDDKMETELTSRDVTVNADSVFYTVQKGDSLSKIAKAHYGNSGKYHAIFEANKPMLKSPELIYPGQMLRIPPLQED